MEDLEQLPWNAVGCESADRARDEGEPHGAEPLEKWLRVGDLSGALSDRPLDRDERIHIAEGDLCLSGCGCVVISGRRRANALECAARSAIRQCDGQEHPGGEALCAITIAEFVGHSPDQIRAYEQEDPVGGQGIIFGEQMTDDILLRHDRRERRSRCIVEEDDEIAVVV
ncbi:hypothetical protein NH287_06440 [Microbacterium sp. CnD16-F]|uniref:hypothetical protein n=1 Tax=unclassified Microbacterium TaxID=2609290 RepID=UPI002096906E|nr:hypothetical protein [Microbacterium sp. CnD16-F]MCO7203137.1 hypothetical protein [Microbacterium sp. CnD16-F]